MLLVTAIAPISSPSSDAEAPEAEVANARVTTKWPVILMHGFGGSGAGDFYGAVPQLQAAGYLVPDFSASSGGCRNPNYAAVASGSSFDGAFVGSGLNQMGDMCKQEISEIFVFGSQYTSPYMSGGKCYTAKVNIIAVSMGTQVARSMIKEYPTYFDGHIHQLILVVGPNWGTGVADIGLWADQTWPFSLLTDALVPSELRGGAADMVCDSAFYEWMNDGPTAETWDFANYPTSGLHYNVKEDGRYGDTNLWGVYDNSPAGTITNVEEGGNNVIQLSGGGTGTGYRFPYSSANYWNAQNVETIKWSQKFSESYTVYVSCDTTAGHRYIYYTASNSDSLGTGGYVHHGLGSGTTDGNWRTFTRDLQADLHDAQPTVDIIDVNAILWRGSGRVDDIMLKQDSSGYADIDCISCVAAVPDGGDWNFEGLLNSGDFWDLTKPSDFDDDNGDGVDNGAGDWSDDADIYDPDCFDILVTSDSQWICGANNYKVNDWHECTDEGLPTAYNILDSAINIDGLTVPLVGQAFVRITGFKASPTQEIEWLGMAGEPYFEIYLDYDGDAYADSWNHKGTFDLGQSMSQGELWRNPTSTISTSPVNLGTGGTGIKLLNVYIKVYDDDGIWSGDDLWCTFVKKAVAVSNDIDCPDSGEFHMIDANGNEIWFRVMGFTANPDKCYRLQVYYEKMHVDNDNDGWPKGDGEIYSKTWAGPVGYEAYWCSGITSAGDGDNIYYNRYLYDGYILKDAQLRVRVDPKEDDWPFEDDMSGELNWVGSASSYADTGWAGWWGNDFGDFDLWTRFNIWTP